MAKNPASRNPLKKKGKKNEPYRPLAPSFETQSEFDKAAEARARSQYQPQAQEINRLGREERGRHKTRGKEIKGWSKYYGNTLQSAFKDTKNALNDLMVASSGTDESTRATLAAALRAQDQQADSRAASLGVDFPESRVPDGAAAYAKGTQGGLLQALAALTTGAASRQTLAPVLRGEMMRSEAGRTSAITRDLAGQRKDLVNRIPSFREAARSELSQEEVNKRNLRFQQGLARREFNLKAAQTGEQNRQFWAQLGLEKEKFEHAKDVDFASLANQQRELDIRAQQAQGTGNAENAKLEAERYNHGVEILTNYLTPTKREDKKGLDIFKSRDPMELYNMLKKRANLPPAEAMRLVNSVQQNGWRNFKPKRYRGMKKRGPVGQAFHEAGKSGGNAGKNVADAVRG